ncbi:MAG: Hsp33 family molecular chaperone HslO [Clostridia bacterium]
MEDNIKGLFNMGDYMVRGLAFNDTVRAIAVDLTQTVNTAQEKHASNPTATAALGRLMTASAVMGSNLKDGQKLTLTVNGGGPLGDINAQIDEAGNIRGYVQKPHILIPPINEEKLAVANGVGKNGMLHVTLDYGLEKPYKGSVELISGQIAEDVAYYFVKSEQIPTIFAAGVLIGEEGVVRSAGGYLIQVLPDAEDEVIEELENIMKSVKPVSRLLDQGYSPEDVLSYLLKDYDLRFLEDKKEFQFKCNCNKNSLEAALTTLNEDDLNSFLDLDNTEVCCQYCSTCYTFTKEEIDNISKQARESE